MSERKRFSKRRELALYMVVDDAITQLRIRILKGALAGASRDGMEEAVWKMIGDLPEKVAEKYRERIAP